jgi:hypothetical protein
VLDGIDELTHDVQADILALDVVLQQEVVRALVSGAKGM